MHLMTALLAAADSQFLLTIFQWAQAAVGLGAVIFVHELGHFLVAKACGVKCEKFYLGFDIYGLKLCHFQWGETEYGIGILPLGGYVKMLGQDDNPSRAAEERERSLALAEHSGDLPPEPTSDPHPKYDPRSYMAQSVPKRMAIISAGVIMNVIFAFACASIAYSLGVEYLVCDISGVTPGEAAWQAGLMPGDKIIQIGDGGKPDESLRFQDLFSGVALGDIDQGITLKIRRPGVEQPITVVARPDKARMKARGRPTIGALPPRTTTLADPELLHPSPLPAPGQFKGDDKVVAINETKTESFADVQRELGRHPDVPLSVTVERKKDPKDPKSTATEQVTVTVPPAPEKTIGLVMGWGPITAIQDGSPAKQAGLRPGDKLVKVDGQPVSGGAKPLDPMRFPDQMRQRAMAAGEKTVKLTIARKSDNGQENEEDKTVTLIDPLYYDQVVDKNSPVTVPAMGIAYSVLNTVAAVEPSSPAEQAGIKPGDQVSKAVLIPSERNKDNEGDSKARTVEFDDQNLNWPSFVNRLQYTMPDTKFQVTLRRGDQTVEVTVPAAVAATDWYFPDRGFVFEALTDVRIAGSAGEAMKLGWRETRDALLMVFRILQKLSSGQLAVSNLGGPGSIAVVAGQSAQGGLSTLLIFLTMLSANLAVINFLPIPILDGGHMVFLLYEGIRGKPASERVMTTLTYAGLFFILGLMVLVIGLDIDKFIKWLGG